MTAIYPSNPLPSPSAAPMPSRGIEDREDVRHEQGLPAIQINDLGDEWVGLFATMLNFSRRGFCLRIPFLLAAGNAFEFEMRLPDGERLSGKAQCRWTRPGQDWLLYDCGSEITWLGPKDAERWGRFVG